MKSGKIISVLRIMEKMKTVLINGRYRLILFRMRRVLTTGALQRRMEIHTI